jgi:hypothetical protein
MTTNRKAQLQRKLSMKAVPEPPAGLRERLRNDIPAFLPPKRRWFARPMLQIAASITLLITAVTVTMLNLQPGEEPQMPSSVRQPRAEMPVARPSEPADAGISTASTSQAVESPLTPAEDLLLAKAEGARRAIEIQQSRERQAAGREGERAADAVAVSEPMLQAGSAREEAEVAGTRDTSMRDFAAKAAPRPSAGDATHRSAAVMAASPVHPAPASAPPPPPAPPPAPPRMAAETAVADDAASNTAEADLEDVRIVVTAGAFAQPVSGAGSDATARRSYDAFVVERLVRWIGGGSRPKVTESEVAQIIIYFARTEERPTAGSDQLEIEMSSPALDPAEQSVILRVSLHPDPSSGPFVNIEVDADPPVVALQRIGAIGSGPAVPSGVGAGEVTALYRVTLRRDVTPSSRIARIRIRYLSDTGKQLQSSERSVAAGDVRRDWREASLRHRLTILAAAFGESLVERPQTASQIATLAASLAQEHPGHERAQDLARITRGWADLVEREARKQP